MKVKIVDTNVPVVANGKRTHASEDCQIACIATLRSLVERGRVVLDAGGLIFEQYRRHLSLKGQPGVGDMFVKFVFDNMYRSKFVELVEITPIEGSHHGFAEFPDDPDLAKFDPADRVFVAVACAKVVRVPIVNATDGGWSENSVALRRHRVIIEELCEADGS